MVRSNAGLDGGNCCRLAAMVPMLAVASNADEMAEMAEAVLVEEDAVNKAAEVRHSELHLEEVGSSDRHGNTVAQP